MKICFLLFFLIFLSSCQKKNTFQLSPDNKKFVRVYVVLLSLKDSFPSDDPAIVDSSRAILQKYRFTREEYERQLAYFNEKPERWEAFYNEALIELKNKKKASVKPN